MTDFPDTGAIAYVSADPASGYNAVRRFHKNTAPAEHRDCTCTSIAGYTSDGIIGYTGGSLPGTEAIDIGVSGTDVATYRSSDPLSGYTLLGIPGYGYPRYDSDAESILSLSAGGTTVESNLVAGGAVWRWTADGIEYLDQNDYGRLMQSALFFTDTSTGLDDHFHYADPNEAGDRFGYFSDPALRHGSPMGKDLTLDFNGMGEVAEYDTILTLPAALNTYHNPLESLLCPSNPKYCARTPSLDVPAVYFDVDFHDFSSYDAATQTLAALVPPSGGEIEWHPTSGYGGVIVSDSTDPSTGHAMGLYGVSPDSSPAGSVTVFKAGDLRTGNNGGAPTTQFQAIFIGPMAAGTTTYHSWVLTGTVDDVVAGMDALYAAGVH